MISTSPNLPNPDSPSRRDEVGVSEAALPDREKTILELWERAAGLDRWRRDDALLAESDGSPRGLGARNVGLLAVRNALFGRTWSLRSHCPGCATECEFEADGVALANDLSREAAPREKTFEWAGGFISARAPTVDDLVAVSSRNNSREEAVRALLARCLDGELDFADLENAAVEDIAGRLEQLDPGAIVGFQALCPTCGNCWSATLDVGEALWTELQRSAEQTLIEVDALARAYGWSEAEIMRLSPMRRAAYLQLVEGT